MCPLPVLNVFHLLLDINCIDNCNFFGYVTINDFGGQAWFELNVIKPQKLLIKGTFFPYFCTIVPTTKICSSIHSNFVAHMQSIL